MRAAARWLSAGAVFGRCQAQIHQHRRDRALLERASAFYNFAAAALPRSRHRASSSPKAIWMSSRWCARALPKRWRRLPAPRSPRTSCICSGARRPARYWLAFNGDEAGLRRPPTGPRASPCRELKPGHSACALPSCRPGEDPDSLRSAARGASAMKAVTGQVASPLGSLCCGGPRPRARISQRPSSAPYRACAVGHRVADRRRQDRRLLPPGLRGARLRAPSSAEGPPSRARLREARQRPPFSFRKSPSRSPPR